MAAEELKAKMRRLYEEGWNKGNMAVLDEVYAPNIIWHHPNNPQEDLEGAKAFVARARARYPDIHYTIDDLMAAEGDKVVMRWTCEGTDTGGSPPTGKKLKATGIMIFRFEQGKVVEEWEEVGVQK
jgi:steroid delta-isomerase-like uncharacterized protein